MESHKRSIAKSLSWRVCALLITMAVSLIVTHKIAVALTIGSIDCTFKLLVYYGHERLWNRLSYGRKVDPDYSI